MYLWQLFSSHTCPLLNKYAANWLPCIFNRVILSFHRCALVRRSRWRVVWLLRLPWCINVYSTHQVLVPRRLWKLQFLTSPIPQTQPCKWCCQVVSIPGIICEVCTGEHTWRVKHVRILPMIHAIFLLNEPAHILDCQPIKSIVCRQTTRLIFCL